MSDEGSGVSPAGRPLWSPPPGPYAGQTFAAPYQSAPRGSFADPPRRRSPVLGTLALVVAVVAIATSVAGSVAAFRIGVGTGAQFTAPTSASGLAFLSPVRDSVLLAEVSLWTGTGLGIWAFVQGLVATITARGRAPGIAAIVVAAVAPFVFFAAAGIALGSGLNAASAFGG